MNYRIIAHDGLPRIVKTPAAVGGNVVGELRAARAALWRAVEEEIRTLRAARDAAIKTRDGDLVNEDAEAAAGLRALNSILDTARGGLDIPPAPSEQADDPLPDELRDIPAHLKRT